MNRYKVKLKGQERKYTVSDNPDNQLDEDSQSESSVEFKTKKKTKEVKEPKGIEGLITICNPNWSNSTDLSFDSTYNYAKDEKKIEGSKNSFDEKLTEEAQADMARLALIRRQRQIDAEARELERQNKEEQQKLKKELALKKLTKDPKKKHVSRNHRKDWNHDNQK